MGSKGETVMVKITPGDYRRGYKDADDIEEYLSKIVESTKSRDARIKRLQEENQKLKDKHYKDAELSKMKEELERARKDLIRGFPVSEEEQKKINEWQKEHVKEFHGGKIIPGAAGENYEYIFYPTGLGVIGSIKCSCGISYCFQNI